MEGFITTAAKIIVVCGAVIGGCGVASVALALTYKRNDQEDVLGSSVFVIGLAVLVVGFLFVWLGRTTLQTLMGG